MDEQHLLRLLRHIIEQLLPNESELSDRELLTQRIAEACWDGLILLMRNAVGSQTEICLEGFGYFFRHEDEWWFRPAAPIVEAQALELERERGSQFLAERALFFLRQGVSILELIPEDINLHSDTSATEETLLSASLPLRSQTKAATLRQAIQSIERQLANIRHILEVSSPGSSVLVRQEMVHQDSETMAQEVQQHYEVIRQMEGVQRDFQPFQDKSGDKARKVGTPINLPDDAVLVARVRAQIGDVVSQPGAINVTAHQGHVTLSGPVPADEVDKLLATVETVRGVTEVVNRLIVPIRRSRTRKLKTDTLDVAQGSHREILSSPMAIEVRETAGLIGIDKVEGTYVYDAKGEHIGSIERVMIDKRSGHVAYAVLSFGGFLGIGSDYYPIPWASLTYDTSLGGYRTNITEQQLKGAPKYTGTNWDWEDRARGRKVYDYYGTPWREY